MISEGFRHVLSIDTSEKSKIFINIGGGPIEAKIIGLMKKGA